MENIETLLESCGLSEAIPVFREHKIRMDQLDELTDEDIKELLPALSDRLDLRKGIQRRRCHSSKKQKKTKFELTPRKKILKNDPEKKAYIVRMLTNHRQLAELYQMATKVLIEFSLFSFGSGSRTASSDWTLIDFVDGSLNCLLCKRKIRIQTRSGSDIVWNVGNYKRHFKEEHINDLSNFTKETEEFNSILEVLMPNTEDETLPTADATELNFDVSSEEKKNRTDRRNLQKNQIG